MFLAGCGGLGGVWLGVQGGARGVGGRAKARGGGRGVM